MGDPVCGPGLFVRHRPQRLPEEPGPSPCKARALAASRRVELRFQQADLATWPFPTAEFDVIVAIFIQFADPPFRRRIFDGIKQALKPGGLLLMQGYRPEQLNYWTGGPSQIENLYTRALLEDAFRDFASLDIIEQDSMVDEGGAHAGKAAHMPGCRL